jgi:hypothetical protein
MLYAHHLIHLCPKLCALWISWWLYIRRNPDIQAAIGTLDISNYSLILPPLPAFAEDAFGLIFSNVLFWWESDSHDWISLCGMNWKHPFLLGKLYGKFPFTVKVLKKNQRPMNDFWNLIQHMWMEYLKSEISYSLFWLLNGAFHFTSDQSELQARVRNVSSWKLKINSFNPG